MAGGGAPDVDMTVVYDRRCLAHDPAAEIWLGVRTPGTEVPERLSAITGALSEAGATLTPPRSYDDQPLLAVHDSALLEWLQTAWEEWVAAGLTEQQDRVVPYVFPLAEITSGRRPRRATRVTARAGMFAYDTMTLIGPGTWEAVRAAAECALTAADLVFEGHRAAYAAVRPPGHHVTRSAFGGSCYLNNAALAAQRLIERGVPSVAVIDLDAHHGNGTQEIFYGRSEVRYGSVHVDPGAGWFPHYVGFGDERGKGSGRGANLNLPIPPGSGDDAWLTAVERLGEFAGGAAALVVSLGVDAAAADPESPLLVSLDGYRRAGEILAGLGLPTVLVQEGGYHLPSLGGLVVTTLAAW